MNKADEYKVLIRERLSDYRYFHSMCVAKSAMILAEKYGGNVEKAYLAGLLHDIMKETDNEIQLQTAEKIGIILSPLERGNIKLYHAISGYAYCKSELNIADDELLNSIRYHTTARADMTLLDKIIYIADFISDDRDYDDVDIMREKAKISLECAMEYAMKYTIVDLVKKGQTIHPDTISAYNQIIINNKK